MCKTGIVCSKTVATGQAVDAGTVAAESDLLSVLISSWT